MAIRIAPLTDLKCRQAKYTKGGKTRIFDGGGLYLELLPSGAKKWRMKYRRPATAGANAGRENRLTFGDYPEVSLAQARDLRREAQRCLDAGADPGEAMAAAVHATKLAAIPGQDALVEPEDSFQKLAAELLDLRRASWSAGYHARISNTLKNDGFPRFGRKAVGAIRGIEVLEAAKVIQARGARVMAERFLDAVGMVLDYAVGTGRAGANVARGLAKFLDPKPVVQHFAHVSEADLPRLLLLIEQYHGRPETKFAIKLLMRSFLRTSEMIWAQWSEVDFEGAVWSIPAARMKGTKVAKAEGSPHLVPLSRQCLEDLRRLHEFTGRYRLMFPGIRNPASSPISAETINKALKIMGFNGEQTGHGFRGLASTILNERSGFRPDVIERQLAHKEKNKIRRAYNHADYMDERRALMQWWADYLDARLAEAKAMPPNIPAHAPIMPPK